MSQTLTPAAFPVSDAERLAELKDLLARHAPMAIYLDTETTGLGPDAELLEISLVDDAGNVLLDTLLKPARCTEWPEAQAINGISPADVQNAPSLECILPHLIQLIESAGVLVIYNAPYDLGMLPEPARALAAPKAVCAMRAYSLHVGEWSESRQMFRRHKLVAAAEAAGHQWEGTAHRAYADTMAVRSVWQWLCRTAA